MLINCPKCNFSQPQDQYCASCGVDMLAYRPKQKPFFQRLVVNPVFQIAALALVVIGVYSLVGYQHRMEIRDRISDIENASNTQIVQKHESASVDAAAKTEAVANETAGATTTEVSATEAQPEAAVAAAPVAQSLVAEAPEPAAAAEEAAPPAPREATAAAAPAAAPTNVRVVFAEIQKPFLAELLADARTPASVGSIHTGVVANLDKRLSEKSQEWSMVDQAAPKPIKAGAPAIFYNGLRDEASGQFVGYAVEVNPSGEDPSQLQVTVWRMLRGENGQVEEFQVPLPDTFAISRDTGIFIAGSMPRRSPSSTEAELYRGIKVLSVLNRESFRAGASDFVIFIQPK